MEMDEIAQKFEQGLLDTNRGYNYYVDWSNITGLDKYQVEIHAMDVLIHCDEELIKNKFRELLVKLPSVVEVFPFLFALAKTERESVIKNESLKIIGNEIDGDDFGTFNFNGDTFKECCDFDVIDTYYDFFVKMGLKSLFQNLLEKSVWDYITGVLVGMDSNGRKNRGGKAFELACEPLISRVCAKYDLLLLSQKKFKYLKKFGVNISDDEENRKADFIIVNKKYTKCLNIEVNFYNGGGSKPEEIIDAYIRRQDDLGKIGIKFALITDGNCWRGTTNQLAKGFKYLKYLMNYNLAKSGMLEEMIKIEFGV